VIEVNPAEFRRPPLRHQLEGIRALIQKPAFALFDEMGVAKTKQTIDAACLLYRAKKINAVVVVAPAGVRSTWDDPEEGELAKDSWVDYHTVRYDNRRNSETHIHPYPDHLLWIVTNYEFLRSPDRLKIFKRQLRNSKLKFLLVLDESARVKSRKAAQTRAAMEVRDLAARCVLLNGTPQSQGVMDLWSQFTILDPKILGEMNFFQFRNRYGVMGGWMMKQVVGSKNEVELARRTAPYLLRRMKVECLDLPPKTYERMDVPLGGETWRLYEEMRDEMVAWLGIENSIASHGAIKALRLAQISAGYLGGVEEGMPAREIGREKLDAFLDWANDHRDQHLVVWCRFTEELKRVVRELRERRHDVVWIAGGQSDIQRTEAKNHFSTSDKPVVLVGQPQAGGLGLNLQRASLVAYLSNDYNLVTRLQSEDRCHRQGQTSNKVTYVDFVATTPRGTRTMDHVILKALKRKEEMAEWTTARWREELEKL
jgi:SNF2 family DNA or RNA helicase